MQNAQKQIVKEKLSVENRGFAKSLLVYLRDKPEETGVILEEKKLALQEKIFILFDYVIRQNLSLKIHMKNELGLFEILEQISVVDLKFIHLVVTDTESTKKDIGDKLTLRVNRLRSMLEFEFYFLSAFKEGIDQFQIKCQQNLQIVTKVNANKANEIIGPLIKATSSLQKLIYNDDEDD